MHLYSESRGWDFYFSAFIVEHLLALLLFLTEMFIDIMLFQYIYRCVSDRQTVKTRQEESKYLGI